VFVIFHDSLGAPSAKLSSVPRIILLSKTLLCVSGHLLIYAYLGVWVSKRRKGRFAPVPMRTLWFSASKDAF